MDVDVVSSAQERKSADVLIIPVWQEKKKPELAFKSKEWAQLLSFPLQSGDFLAAEGETLLLYPNKGKEKRLLLLGLGDKSSCLPDALRRAYGSAVKILKTKKLASVNILFPETELLARDVVCKAVVEGCLLANYSFDQFKAEKKKPLSKICFCGLAKQESALVRDREKIVAGVNFARDLINGNADDVNVDRLCLEAKGLAKKFPKIKTTILDKKHLEKEKMGLLLAVGKGASKPPALILMEYRGDPKSKELTAIVGKGVTYDTGGLNLKPTGGMETMKTDMSGSAATLGIIRTAAALGLKKNLLGVLAVAENAIGPASYKPGDVYKSHAGKTVEIANTDAEGRLVLADALSYIQEKFELARIIDLATLTGGVVVALGEECAGLFCNDEKLTEQLEQAAERTHDRVWRLPLHPEYKELIKSSIADIKNSGNRKASPCTGAIFLAEFIKKEIPWAHVDIAGTAYLSEPAPYHPTSATGAGVRLLIDFLEQARD